MSEYTTDIDNFIRSTKLVKPKLKNLYSSVNANSIPKIDIRAAALKYNKSTSHKETKKMKNKGYEVLVYFLPERKNLSIPREGPR